MSSDVHLVKKGAPILVMLAALTLLLAQDGGSGFTIPEALVRPFVSDAPRYPRDIVIGELGRGELEANHLKFANDVLQAVFMGRERSALLAPLQENARQEIIERIAKTRPSKFRVGGGKAQADGSLSFLFRFIGTVSDIGGELYFMENENGFTLDDIILEDIPGALFDDDKDRAYNMSPYERFY